MGWGSRLLEFADGAKSFNLQVEGRESQGRNLDFASLLQVCGELGSSACQQESLHIALLVSVLCSGLVFVCCLLAVLRDDREDYITPLSPQFVVKRQTLGFKMPADPSDKQSFDVTGLNDEVLCRVFIDWPDIGNQGLNGVTATLRVQSLLDMTIATVVARSVAVVGQSLALCRAGCEIFGFVEVDDTENLFTTRHRTGLPLIKLRHDPESSDLELHNSIGMQVSTLRCDGAHCVGHVCAEVDFGLVLCTVLASRVHHWLQERRPVAPWNPLGKSAYSLESGLPAFDTARGTIEDVPTTATSADDRNPPLHA